ncbi:MAG: VWA domain-containing protein [Candidatus Krumholzibacteriota bacterium]
MNARNRKTVQSSPTRARTNIPGHLIFTAVLMAAALLTVIIAMPAAALGETEAKAETRPRIEVCFVLDTTGSMSGLIEGAKVKIWSIANQMIAAEPTPELSIGLIGYRDRGDEYITRIFDLDGDIDAVYADLQGFAAGGGGDTPESVQQALHEAVTQISWSPDSEVLKIIFLVGDCPPHFDYPQDTPYRDTCQEAVKNDLIINTVQCGNFSETTPIWQDIADLAEGSFVAIGQSGDMQVVAAPQDKRLAELNVALGLTLVPYGSMEAKDEVAAKQSMSEFAPASAAVDRLAYNSKTGKVVQGRGDLVDDIEAGHTELDKLGKEELPAAMQDMTTREQVAYLAEQKVKRQEIQNEIDSLLKDRQAFIAEEMKAVAVVGGRSGFDAEVKEMIQRQAAEKGIEYDGE